MTWIQTYTGRKFSLLDPQPEDVCIQDIAHALTNICRFQGHCKGFYSVAQHSVHVADLCPTPYKLDAILHDAGEAYYGDITRPQKIVFRAMTQIANRCGQWSAFDAFTKRIDRIIAMVFHLSESLPDCVSRADDVMLATEARDLLLPPPLPWPKLPAPLRQTVAPWMPEEACAQFMRTYEDFKQ
jgi:hypothetical protein